MVSDELNRSEIAPDVRPRGPVALALRPFGYALVGAVWTVLGLGVLGLGPGILLFLGWADLAGSEGITWMEPWSRITGSVGETAAFVLAIPLLALIWGPAVLWMLPCASIPLALLSLTYVGRSLRPRFAGDALSFTTHGARGSTTGVTATSVALSLQPVHRSRWTDLLMRFYVEGWEVSLRSLVGMFPAGFAYLLLVLAAGVDVPVAVRVVCAVLAVGLAAWSAVLIRRHWLARFHGRELGAAGRAQAGRRVTDLPAAERTRRLAELKKRRAARQAGR